MCQVFFLFLRARKGGFSTPLKKAKFWIVKLNFTKEKSKNLKTV